MLVLLFSLQVSAGATKSEVQDKKPENVELEKGDSTNKDLHLRTLIPFSCVYVDGMVQLTLVGEVGDYTLTVTNQLTGEQWLDTNSLLLNVSTTSGTYLVQIVTEDGTCYYGIYTL